MDMLTLFVVAAMLATVAALTAGVTAMTQDGEIGHRTSAQWMVLRVTFQLAAILLILFSFLG